MRLGARAALVDGDLVAGDVDVDGADITAVGLQPAGRGGVAVPGFVDLQVNGFGGIDFLSTGIDGFATARRALASTGVTSFLPTLVTAPLDSIGRALEVIASLPDDGPRVLGVHLEGPFLAPKWKGAHDEQYLLPPDVRVAAELCAKGPVRMMTIAPELDHGMELLNWLVANGVVVSLGHTDADAATADVAFDRGARAVTHLHNAQRRFTARDPGISGVALTRPDVVVQVIADFVHLAPETVLAAQLAAGARLSLVTDAIAAAGASSGDHPLGRRTVHVDGSAARLADGTLAGSILTMDQAVRNLVDLGVSLGDAVHAASTTPAGLIGRSELGTLHPGTPADIVVLDDGLTVRRTLVNGVEVFAR